MVEACKDEGGERERVQTGQHGGVASDEDEVGVVDAFDEAVSLELVATGRAEESYAAVVGDTDNLPVVESDGIEIGSPPGARADDS